MNALGRFTSIQPFFPLKLAHVAAVTVATFLVVLIASGLTVYLMLFDVRARMEHLGKSDHIMLIESLEMEVSFVETGISTLEFLAEPTAVNRSAVSTHLASLNQHLDKFSKAAQGDAEQGDYVVKARELFGKHAALTGKLLEQRMAQENLFAHIQQEFRAIDNEIDDKFSAGLDQGYPDRAEKLRLAALIKADGAEIHANLSDYLRTHSVTSRESLAQAIASFHKNFSTLLKLRVQTDKRTVLDRIALLFSENDKKISALLELDAAMYNLRNEKARLRKSLDDLLDGNVQLLAGKSLSTALGETQRVLNQIAVFVFSVTLLMLAGAALTLLYVRRNVQLPMRNLLDALESIFRTGSLDARVAVAGAPEVRTLGVRFNHMLSQLHATMVSKAELEVSRNRLQSEVAERRNTQSALDESNQRLQVLAELDELTGLPNRRRFMDIIMQAIPRAARTKAGFAVLFVDLDHFKEVNDTLGHDVGDALLQEVAKRLRASVRAEDTVARMGGDEFTLLLAETAARDDAAIVAQKIMEDFRNPVQAGAHLLFWQASVGIATYPEDGLDAVTLLKAADSALYRSKEEGRSRYNFYSADLTVRAMRRAEITRELRMALERNQLSLHYQPQFQVAGGAMVGVEALLRWNHPVWGMVRPDEFIPIAEDSGLILPIGEWVLQTACTQARAWVAAGLRLRVGVNLSVRELSGEDVVASVERNLRGLDPGLLEIEITESLAMKNPDAAALVLTKFRALGVGIAMDDFGTGHSSLSRIKNLPLDRLKIDRSFVHTIGETEDGAELAHAVISIGRALKLRIIAEGIENAEQLEFLCNAGCEEYQGYYGGRPMPAESITQLLI